MRAAELSEQLGARHSLAGASSKAILQSGFNKIRQPAMTRHDVPDTAGFERRPGFPMSFHPTAKRIRVKFAGATVADSRQAMVMDEDGHRPVYYFPKEDVSADHLSATTHSTR